MLTVFFWELYAFAKALYSSLALGADTDSQIPSFKANIVASEGLPMWTCASLIEDHLRAFA
jgi:hypothetical protein